MERLLLDSNAVLRLFKNQLSGQALACIRDAQSVYVSHVTFWEFAIKSALGKLSPILPGLEQRLVSKGFDLLPITLEHILRISYLPQHHRDPFDRMLISQAQVGDLMVMTADRHFAQYGVATVEA